MDQTLRPDRKHSSSYCDGPIDANAASLDVMIMELKSQNERLQEIISELLIKNQCLRFGIETGELKNIETLGMRSVAVILRQRAIQRAH